jgi:LEA14-like dessication related protein
MKIIHILVLSSILLALHGCIEIKELQCAGVQKFKLNSINTEKVDADVFLKIKNPNNVGFTIAESEFDVSYGGLTMGKAKLIKPVKIEGNTEDVYAFKLQSDFKNTLSLDNVVNLLLAVNQAGIVDVKGYLQAKKGFIAKKFPINYQQKISIE